MYRTLFLGCLICASHGRRVQNVAQDDTSTGSLQSLATFLLAMNPMNPSLNARFRAARPAVSPFRTPIMTAQPQASTITLASDCLDEGCPVDMVKTLLTTLKAEKDSSPDIAKTIEELEKLLASSEPNKNELERIVGDMVRTFTVLDDGPALGYTGVPNKGGWSDKFFKAPRRSTVDLASNCLEEGCPVDMVTDLLTQLKAEENPSPEAEKMIMELEELLASPEPNKNAIEQLITNMVDGLKASYVTPNQLIDGMFGDKK